MEEFLNAWWGRSLTDPGPAVPVHELLALCAAASGTLTPWLDAWETLDHPLADRHVALAADEGEYRLLGDELLWDTWDTRDDEDALRVELAAWPVRYDPGRLRGLDVTDELLHRVRLTGLTGPARWQDPHCPHRSY